ncbi:hypothetical protein ACFWPH_30265 [Nocardia sp. NPDC058499]|uniref:hypothetical protein n=1 Tax=Nocardia sp. NPDC058499 TaxID=3346530 RepID=UPI003667145D
MNEPSPETAAEHEHGRPAAVPGESGPEAAVRNLAGPSVTGAEPPAGVHRDHEEDFAVRSGGST